MPGFKATVIGENFDFMVDDEPQLLEFSRTLYVDAPDETAAQAMALAMVREALISQALLNDESNQLITVDNICHAVEPEDKEIKGEFIWYFPDEDEFDEED